jgi:small subunit ribosomal protein S16
MLAIKLRRIGKKRQASFRVVLMEKRSKLSGKFVEDLGWFNPHTDKFEIKKERAEYWLQVGAKPTDSVHNIFVRAGILKAAKIPVHKKSKKATDETSKTPQAQETSNVEDATEAPAMKIESEQVPITE